MKYQSTDSAPVRAAIFFWISCALMLLGFWVEHPVSYLLLAFFIPVFYGAHEALHDTLIPRKGISSMLRDIHEGMALLVGFSLQGMNFRLLRPAHLHHHTFGRYDEGYAPDVFDHTPTLKDRFRYYISLIGLPAIAWQLAGFAKLVFPTENLPFFFNMRFERENSKIPYLAAQIGVIVFFAYAVWVGGWFKFLLFETIFCFTWSVLQNVSHYGLRGIDPQTDRVCARTYILEWPFNWITFGSTSHLAHHVDMTIPGDYLYNPEVLAEIESRLGVKIEIKYGIFTFLTDVFRQFKGPLTEQDLDTTWIKSVNKERDTNRVPETFGSRTGRKWVINQSSNK